MLGCMIDSDGTAVDAVLSSVPHLPSLNTWRLCGTAIGGRWSFQPAGDFPCSLYRRLGSAYVPLCSG